MSDSRDGNDGSEERFEQFRRDILQTTPEKARKTSRLSYKILEREDDIARIERDIDDVKEKIGNALSTYSTAGHNLHMLAERAKQAYYDDDQSTSSAREVVLLLRKNKFMEQAHRAMDNLTVYYAEYTELQQRKMYSENRLTYLRGEQIREKQLHSIKNIGAALELAKRSEREYERTLANARARLDAFERDIRIGTGQKTRFVYDGKEHLKDAVRQYEEAVNDVGKAVSLLEQADEWDDVKREFRSVANSAMFDYDFGNKNRHKAEHRRAEHEALIEEVRDARSRFDDTMGSLPWSRIDPTLKKAFKRKYEEAKDTFNTALTTATETKQTADAIQDRKELVRHYLDKAHNIARDLERKLERHR